MFAENSQKILTLVGGTGFIGRHLVRTFAKQGYRIRVACRRPDLAGYLLPAGFPGQIMPVQANIRYPDSIQAACEGAFAVITSVGTLTNQSVQSYHALHHKGPEAVARAAKAAGAEMLLHISSLNADENGPSDYARSKAAGEKQVKNAFQGAIILRPSLVFGPEDQFFNKFADMARFSIALPLIGGGNSKFDPVFVGDIAEAAAHLIGQGKADGKIYELGGPQVFTFRELMEFTLKTIDRRRLLLPIPWGMAKVMGTVLGALPGHALTADQVTMLRTDTLVSASAKLEGRDLAGLGIKPQAIQDIVPRYLYRYRRAGQFSAPDGIAD